MTERSYVGAIDRAGWGAGPWDDEPDKVQWIDEATGLDCLAVRNHHGSWCGYVGLPPGHRLHGVHYGELELEFEVHGGLTFADRCMEGPEDRGVCHVPEPGRPVDVWWLGFDCGHFLDVMPRMDALMRGLDMKLPRDELRERYDHHLRDIYWTLGMVRAEVTSLAGQLASL